MTQGELTALISVLAMIVTETEPDSRLRDDIVVIMPHGNETHTLTSLMQSLEREKIERYRNESE